MGVLAGDVRGACRCDRESSRDGKLRLSVEDNDACDEFADLLVVEIAERCECSVFAFVSVLLFD